MRACASGSRIKLINLTFCQLNEDHGLIRPLTEGQLNECSLKQTVNNDQLLSISAAPIGLHPQCERGRANLCSTNGTFTQLFTLSVSGGKSVWYTNETSHRTAPSVQVGGGGICVPPIGPSHRTTASVQVGDLCSTNRTFTQLVTLSASGVKQRSHL